MRCGDIGTEVKHNEPAGRHSVNHSPGYYCYRRLFDLYLNEDSSSVPVADISFCDVGFSNDPFHYRLSHVSSFLSSINLLELL